MASPTTLTFVQPGYIDRKGVGKDALDKEMDKLVMRSNQTLLQGARFFRTVSSVTDTYKESDYGNDLVLPPESDDAGNLTFDTPTPGFSKELTVVNRRLAIQVERSLTEDQRFPVAKKMMGGLVRSGRLSIEYLFADILNNLTTDTATYRGADGCPVAYNAHPHPRRSTGTWSNIESAAALTTSTLFTAFKNMRKRVDERGYKYVVKPVLLVGPPDLEKKMAEIKDSALVPENAMNTKNVVPGLGGGWQYMVYDYQTDTNAWWIWGDMPAEENGFMFFQKVAPSIAPLTGRDLSTDIIWGQRLRMRVAAGTRIQRNVQYNEGA
jgi:hypothetical protein